MKNLRASENGTSSSTIDNPDNSMQDTLVKRLMSKTEWTDQKHSMYLKSMEASFVNQLYDSKQMLCCSSPKPTFSHPTTASTQLKVLGDGCWQKIKFKRDYPQISGSNECQDSKANPWIQPLKSSSVLEEGVPTTSQVFDLCHRDMFCIDTEMSDQNFVDEEVECEEDNSRTNVKRLKSLITDDLGNEQVRDLKISP